MSSFRSQSSQSLHLGSALLTRLSFSPDFLQPSHFRVNKKKWTKRPYLGSGNLQFYVEKLQATAWLLSSPLAFVRGGLLEMVVGGGDHMVSLPPFIDSQIFTLVLNSHPTMSRNTAAPSFIVDQMTAATFFGHRGHKLRTMPTKEGLWLCIA